MIYNVFLWGFADDIIKNGICRLEAEKVIHVSRWFMGDDRKNTEFFLNRQDAEGSFEKWLSDGCKDDFEYPPVYITEYLEKHMMMILHNVDRGHRTDFMPLGEQINVANQAISHYYYYFKREKPHIVDFAELPHTITGIVLYYLAKSLNIKTLMFTPSNMFLGKSHCIFDLNDYGKFDDVPIFEERRRIEVEEKFEKKIEYMSDDIKNELMGINNSWIRKFRCCVHPILWINERVDMVRRKLSQYENVDEYIEKKLEKIAMKVLGGRIYRKRMTKYATKNCDLNVPYVYFALQCQPEMSTDTLGGYWTDQLLAIEKIHRIIPDDWMIYIKENPVQLSYKRGTEFFRRLRKIPNTILVDRSFDTYKLIEGSKFVSTITGTVGWEAASGGKPALIFGKIWYSDLPGVFKYNDDLDGDYIADYKVDHDELEEKVSTIVSKLAPFVVSSVVIHLFGISDFNQKENEELFCDYMKFILPHTL